MAHTLVVGGTGMLRGITLYLAAQGHTVSVVARGRPGLDALVQAAARLPGEIDPLPVDYQDSPALRTALEEVITRRGPITLAVCWIHSDAANAPLVVADCVNRDVSFCRYFDVLGSLAADGQEMSANRKLRLEQFAHIRYRRIILGFVIEYGVSRWLTDDEISTGVIQAIERDEACFVVGTVRPWSARP